MSAGCRTITITDDSVRGPVDSVRGPVDSVRGLALLWSLAPPLVSGAALRCRLTCETAALDLGGVAGDLAERLYPEGEVCTLVGSLGGCCALRWRGFGSPVWPPCGWRLGRCCCLRRRGSCALLGGLLLVLVSLMVVLAQCCGLAADRLCSTPSMCSCSVGEVLYDVLRGFALWLRLDVDHDWGASQYRPPRLLATTL